MSSTQEKAFIKAFKEFTSDSSQSNLDDKAQMSNFINCARLMCKGLDLDFNEVAKAPFKDQSKVSLRSYEIEDDGSEPVFDTIYPLKGSNLARATEEGWVTWENSRGEIFVVAHDDNDILKYDNEAWKLVIKAAMRGSKFHINFVKAVKEQQPEEYKLWVNESRISDQYCFDTYYNQNKDACLQNLSL